MRQPNLVNHDALRQVFDLNSLDAIFVTSDKNTYYHSACPVARARVRSRSWPRDVGPVGSAVLVGPEGNVLVTASRNAKFTSQVSWVEDVRGYDEFVETPLEGLVAAAQSLGLAGGRIGFEADYVSVTDWQVLEERMPTVAFVPVDESLEWMRSIKTPGEVEILKNAAYLLDEAILEGFQSARVGDTEWEIHSRIIEGCMRRGSEHCRGLFQSGSSNDLSFGGTGQKRLEPGDIIHIDYAAYFDAYPANLSRVGVVGVPSAEQEQTYADLLAVEKEIIEFMRPGVKGQDVFWFAREALGKRGHAHTAAIVGHNLGLGYHDRPMITEPEIMQLEAGNIVAIEPLIGWAFHIQDQVLITVDGGILQSDSFDTSQLFEMGY